jgi:excisionase family DNA binding protein
VDEYAAATFDAVAVTILGIMEGSSMNGAFLTEPEVADRLRVSLACLRRWRLERRGPRFVKVGSLVRYPADELDRWIESLPVGGTQTRVNGARTVARAGEM